MPFVFLLTIIIQNQKMKKSTYKSWIMQSWKWWFQQFFTLNFNLYIKKEKKTQKKKKDFSNFKMKWNSNLTQHSNLKLCCWIANTKKNKVSDNCFFSYIDIITLNAFEVHWQFQDQSIVAILMVVVHNVPI